MKWVQNLTAFIPLLVSQLELIESGLSIGLASIQFLAEAQFRDWFADFRLLRLNSPTPKQSLRLLFPVDFQ